VSWVSCQPFEKVILLGGSEAFVLNAYPVGGFFFDPIDLCLIKCVLIHTINIIPLGSSLRIRHTYSLLLKFVHLRSVGKS
jgi:hypothetical protein